MKTRHFDHIDLRVKEMAAAKPFYTQLLPQLGFVVDESSGEWCSFRTAGDGPVEFFGFIEDAGHRPNESRIAFWAGSRPEVDRLAGIVRQAGGRNLEGPELCKDYSPGYYAVFFDDPSGNKLEICYRQSAAS
jgi:catechol 2,3-dioxygenase-like lactoylglutathione lyase family enzyme